jgi:hypothetical protein
MFGFNLFVIALLILFVAVIAAGVKIVPQGYNYTIERFGRYTRTLRPGLTLIIPFIDRIGRKPDSALDFVDIGLERRGGLEPTCCKLATERGRKSRLAIAWRTYDRDIGKMTNGLGRRIGFRGNKLRPQRHEHHAEDE